MADLTVACVNVGNYLGRGEEYVAKLRSMCDRHLPPHEFACITESEHPGYWAKLELFRPGRFTGRTLYLDLDVVIDGDLSGLVALLDESPFWIMDDFAWPLSHSATIDAYMRQHPHGEGLRRMLGGPGTCNSSVMLWRDEVASDVWTTYTTAAAEGLHGDQNWITRVMRERLLLIPPGWARSYKFGGRGPILVMHGDVKPHMVPAFAAHSGKWKLRRPG